MLKDRLSWFFCTFSDLFGLPSCEWHLNVIWNFARDCHGVTGGDEEEDLLQCRLKLCTQANGCLEYKESSLKRCCIKTEHQEGLLVERESLVSLGIVSCNPISATVSCQLPVLCPHCGLLPLSLTWLGNQQSGVDAWVLVGCCRGCVSGYGLNCHCHPQKGGEGWVMGKQS